MKIKLTTYQSENLKIIIQVIHHIIFIGYFQKQFHEKLLFAF